MEITYEFYSQFFRISSKFLKMNLKRTNVQNNSVKIKEQLGKTLDVRTVYDSTAFVIKQIECIT